MFINYLKDDFNKINYPSYNNDKSNYLLIELTIDSLKRKLFFYNEDGRGIFDVINDKYETNVENIRGYSRNISSSIAIKVNNSENSNFKSGITGSINNMNNNEIDNNVNDENPKKNNDRITCCII